MRWIILVVLCLGMVPQGAGLETKALSWQNDAFKFKWDMIGLKNAERFSGYLKKVKFKNVFGSSVEYVEFMYWDSNKRSWTKGKFRPREILYLSLSDKVKMCKNMRALLRDNTALIKENYELRVKLKEVKGK